MNKDLIEITFGLHENIKLGLMKIVGKNKKGEDMFSLTKKGTAYVKAMPFKNNLEKAEWLNNYQLESLESKV